MEQPRIVVDVTPDGQVKLDALCFQGSACQQATQALTARLGALGICLSPETNHDKPELALEPELACQRQRVAQ